MPVYEAFQRIPTPFGTIKQYFLYCVCVCMCVTKCVFVLSILSHKCRWPMKVCILGVTNQLSQWVNKWVTTASEWAKEGNKSERKCCWALSIFHQLSWVIAMSSKVWSHQLKGSSIQWQVSLLVFTSSVLKWIFPPFSYYPHTILLIKNWANTQSTNPFICKQKKQTST